MYHNLTITNMSVYVSFLLILINLSEYKSMLLKGKRAQDGQFPWLIQFQTVAPCGGVLLSPDWVLTAAQCVQDKRNSIILFATGLNGTTSKQTVPVKATYIYPMYEAYSVLPDRDYNIALLKLTEPFDTCSNNIILPNVVPAKYDDNYKLCLIFGWQSYVSPSSKILAKPIQYCEVILNSWKMCTYMIKTNANYTNLFCAMVEFKDEIKACAGNPGSPVICENESHATALVGIASWTKFSLECENLPTYLDLGVFRIWINDLVFNDKDKEKLKHGSSESDCKLTIGLMKNITSQSTSNVSDSNVLQTHSQISYASEGTNVQLYNKSYAALNNQEVSVQSTKQPQFWGKLYHIITNNLSDSNASTLNDYHVAPYMDIAKVPSNNAYKYEEIGGIKHSDRIMEKLNKKGARNNSLTCNNQEIDKLMVKNENDEFEVHDFELLLPFNLEDAIMSHASTIIRYRNLYISFHFTFLYLFYYYYPHVVFH